MSAPRSDRRPEQENDNAGVTDSRGLTDLARRRASSWIVAALFVAVAAIAFLLYARSLRNEFVWDDPIVLNQQLQAFHSLRDIFFPPPRIPQFGRLYYRPLIVLTYVIDRKLWGDTPF